MFDFVPSGTLLISTLPLDRSVHIDFHDKTGSKTTSSTSAIVFRGVGTPVKLETISMGTLQPNEALIEIHTVDCTGVPKVVENMINSLGTRGRGCSVGAPKPGSTAAVDIFSHLLFAREYIGCVEGDVNAPKVTFQMIRLIKRMLMVSADDPVLD